VAVVAVGLSYKSAPLELLESSTIPPEHSADALRALVEQDAITEAVILSTCNRVEVYAAGDDEDSAAEAIRNVFVERCRVDPLALDEGSYAHRADAASSHLFRVAAGLDSMIVGEPEILGQVRRCFRVATATGTAGSELSPLFRHALRTGKRVRSETELSRHAGSFAAAAVSLLRGDLGEAGLEKTRAVVLGTGRIAEASARALLRAGLPAEQLVIVGRSEQRAQSVARPYGARHAPLEQLRVELAGAGAAVCCTAAVGTVVDAAAVDSRREPLALVDLAVPRDVDPAVGDLPNVTLHDLADVQAAVAGDEERRLEATRAAETLVAEEAEQFRRARRAAEAGPIISSLVEKAELIRQAELSRVRARLSDTDEEVVDQLTKRIVSSLLHAPIESAREAGDDGTALRNLFRLP
jgi:glutamyl-tRNA reductase